MHDGKRTESQRTRKQWVEKSRRVQERHQRERERRCKNRKNNKRDDARLTIFKHGMHGALKSVVCMSTKTDDESVRGMLRVWRGRKVLLGSQRFLTQQCHRCRRLTESWQRCYHGTQRIKSSTLPRWAPALKTHTSLYAFLPLQLLCTRSLHEPDKERQFNWFSL